MFCDPDIACAYVLFLPFVFKNEGEMLALGVVGGRVMLVDEATGEVKWEVQAHPGGEILQTQVAMSKDGRFVASVGGNDEHWKLWDVASGALYRAGARHDGWESATTGCICEMPGSGATRFKGACPVGAHTSFLLAVAFSPCGQRLATGGKDCAVITWDAHTGKAEHHLKGHSAMVWTVAFSADGARLASGSHEGPIHVWNVSTGVLLRTMQQDNEYDGFGVHFSPTDHNRLAAVGHDIVVWDVDSGENRDKYDDTMVGGSLIGVIFAVFSPDGRTIATAETGAREVQHQPSTGHPDSLVLHPNPGVLSRPV